MTFSPRPVKSILLIGPTGAGKTPLGNLIEKYGLKGRRCFHFDFGHQLRTIAGNDIPQEGFSNEEYLFIRSVLEKGLLLENEHIYLAEKIIDLFLGSARFGEDDILVLNGLPRHRDQAKGLTRRADIDSLVVLECSAEDVHKRIRNNAGNDRDDRIDDGLDMIRKKLAIFNERTAPLVDYFSNAGSKIFRIKVTSSSTGDDLYRSFLSIAG